MALLKPLKYAGIAGVLLLAILAMRMVWVANTIKEYPAPLRVETPLDFVPDDSVVVANISAPLDTVSSRLEVALPKTLVALDERVEECIPREEVSALGVDLFKTPRLGCNLKGEITRGRITLAGAGDTLMVLVPIKARIEILDLGDVVKRETVTAAADVKVAARLTVNRDWGLRPQLNLTYNWSEEPGIDFLGRRVTFTKLADKVLAQSLNDIEGVLEAEIRKVNLRSDVADIWREAHDIVSVNRDNPPGWLRITPRRIGAGSLNVVSSRVSAQVMVAAGLELVVGDRPEPGRPGPLGENGGVPAQPGFTVNVPVLADYAELEPVLLRELQKLSTSGLLREKGLNVSVDFHSVTIYATERNRLAVGIEARVRSTGRFADKYWARSRGRVWLTADPITQEGSEILTIENLEINGDMDRYSGDLLVRLLGNPVIKSRIQTALTTNFRRDYDDVVAKARKGLASVKVGDARLAFDVDEFSHGKVSVTGAGLFMPVTSRGTVAARVTD